MYALRHGNQAHKRIEQFPTNATAPPSIFRAGNMNIEVLGSIKSWNKVIVFQNIVETKKKSAIIDHFL